MSSKYTPEEPISSIATALAPSALGIVRLSGKNCIELASKLFSSPNKLLNAEGNTIVYGWLKDGQDLVDEVMVAVYRAPKSFTGEDMVEIFCHGGPSVVTSVHRLMLKNGFRQAEKGEYTFRAYINGKTDLTRAEAVKEIIDSHTDISRSKAVGRLAGSLFEEIDAIKKLIIDTLAEIEVEIEYPEDEETIADSFDSKDIETARDRLQILCDSWKGEKLYQDGARVVLCGKTNAGKSSLFNAILKEDRAIVSDIAGTTRDFIESWVSFDGIPVRLFDTAGLRETSDVIEAQGVEIAKSLSNDADVVLYLVDGLLGLQDDDKEFLKKCDVPIILVWNKCDKIGNQSSNEKNALDYTKDALSHAGNQLGYAGDSQGYSEVRISAKNSTGLSDLYKAVKKVLTSGLSTERLPAGLGSERQKESVQEALECVNHALITASDNYSLDAVVQDLEDALESLGEVTGEVTPDDVLTSIFANFCVGK